MSQSQVAGAYGLMREDGILDASDFIDSRRPDNGGNTSAEGTLQPGLNLICIQPDPDPGVLRGIKNRFGDAVSSVGLFIENGRLKLQNLYQDISGNVRGYFLINNSEDNLSYTLSGSPGACSAAGRYSNVLGPGLTPGTFDRSPYVYEWAIGIEDNQLYQVNIYNQTLDPTKGYMAFASQPTILGSSGTTTALQSIPPPTMDLERLNSALLAIREQIERADSGLPLDQAAVHQIESDWRTGFQRVAGVGEFVLGLVISQQGGTGQTERTVLAVGLDDDATDDFDEGLDAIQDPSIPSVPHGFVAESYGLSKSFKETGETPSWNIQITSAAEPEASSVGDVEISWALLSGLVPEGETLRLLDDRGEVVVGDMTAVNSITYDAGPEGTQREFTIELGEGGGTGEDPPNLIITEVSGPDDTETGDDPRFRATVYETNDPDDFYRSVTQVPFDVAFYLVDGSSRVFLGDARNATSVLWPTSRTREFSTRVFIPDDITPGRYTIVAVVDAYGEIPESDEGDNEATFSIDIAQGNPSRPNLVMNALEEVPTSVHAGERLRYDFEVYEENDPDDFYDLVAQVPFDVHHAILVDGESYVFDEDQNNTGSLWPRSRTRSFNGSGRIPAGLPPGTYTVQITIDANSEVDETQESDNVISFTVEVTRPESSVVSGEAGWRLLSPPVPGMTVDDLAAMNLVIGVPGYTPDADGSNLYTYYDGATFYTSGTGQTLVSGRGFWWYFYDLDITTGGPSDSRALPMALETSRPPAVTDVSVPLHGTGWNMVGNPYQASLDLGTLPSWDGSDALSSPVAALYDASLNSWAYSDGTTVVAPWQGFFLHTAAPGVVTIPSTARTDGGILGKGGGGSDRAMSRPSLSFTLFEEEGALGDESALLIFDADASNGGDSFDVEQLEPLDDAFVQVAFGRSDGGLLAREGRPDTGTLTIPVHVRGVRSEPSLVLSWSGIETLPGDWGMRLIDHVTGDVTDLRSRTQLPIEIEPATPSAKRLEAPLSMSASATDGARFTLLVDRPGATSSEHSGPAAVSMSPVHPNPAAESARVSLFTPETQRLRLEVFDALGRRVLTLNDKTVSAGSHAYEMNTSTLPNGTYVIRAVAGVDILVQQFTVVR